MKKTLVNYYLLLTLFFTTAVILVVTSVYIKTQQDIFTQNSEELRERVLKQYKMELINRVEMIEQHIDYKKSTADQRLRENARIKVNEAIEIAQAIYLNNQAKMSEANIKKLIVETLRNLRFNDGRGYYFIDTLEGDCVLYPINVDTEGKNILNIQDINKKYVVKAFVEVAKNQNEGFVKYFTYQPQKDKGSHHKISFVKLFKTFDWIIGTGEYVEDVEDDIKKEIASEITQYRIDKNESYINIFEVNNFNGGDDFASMIVSPNYDGNIYGGKISSYIKDIDGVAYNQEALNQINAKSDGFVIYKYKRFHSTEIAPKLSYFKLLKYWNWVISTGKQLDGLEEIIKESETKIQEKIFENIRYASLFFMFIFVFLLLMSFFISRKIKNEIGVITHFLQLASFDKVEINHNKFKIEEFKQLSIYVNAMTKEIKSQHQALSNINKILNLKSMKKPKNSKVSISLWKPKTKN